jgi:hypothetical protein
VLLAWLQLWEHCHSADTDRCVLIWIAACPGMVQSLRRRSTAECATVCGPSSECAPLGCVCRRAGDATRRRASGTAQWGISISVGDLASILCTPPRARTLRTANIKLRDSGCEDCARQRLCKTPRPYQTHARPITLARVHSKPVIAHLRGAAPVPGVGAAFFFPGGSEATCWVHIAAFAADAAVESTAPESKGRRRERPSIKHSVESVVPYDSLWRQ